MQHVHWSTSSSVWVLTKSLLELVFNSTWLKHRNHSSSEFFMFKEQIIFLKEVPKWFFSNQREHIANPSSSRAWASFVGKNVNDFLILLWKSRLYTKHGKGHHHHPINKVEAGRLFFRVLEGVEQFYFSLLRVFGFVAESLTPLSY